MNNERKVILYIAQSLDGYIARKGGEIDWLQGEGSLENLDFGYDKFLSEIDTVVMGRKTYEQIVNELSPDKWAYEGKKSYIFTRNNMDEELLLEENLRDKSNEIIFANNEFGKLYAKTQEYNKDIKFVNKNACEFIRKLKKESGNNIWIVGGAGLLDNLMKEDIIDEYIISTMPIILGDGIRLFGDNNLEVKLKLKSVKGLDGIIISEYERR